MTAIHYAIIGAVIAAAGALWLTYEAMRAKPLKADEPGEEMTVEMLERIYGGDR